MGGNPRTKRSCWLDYNRVQFFQIEHALVQMQARLQYTRRRNRKNSRGGSGGNLTSARLEECKQIARRHASTGLCHCCVSPLFRRRSINHISWMIQKLPPFGNPHACKTDIHIIITGRSPRTREGKQPTNTKGVYSCIPFLFGLDLNFRDDAFGGFLEAYKVLHRRNIACVLFTAVPNVLSGFTASSSAINIKTGG